MNGLVLIDKPKGWTSFDVVAKVRGTIKQATGEKIKVGHTGTLDPHATGLLVLAVGRATKTIESLTKLDKTYEVTLQLGKTSTTDDDEGIITDNNSVISPTREQVETVVQSFIGEGQQVPPIYSAIKVNGKRAYKLAREGKEVEMKPRTVTIHSIEQVAYEWPVVTCVAHVSSGTYIRSLVRDIGEKLGTGAYMSDLRRTTVGSYALETAITPVDITIEQLQTHIIDVSI